MCVRRVCMCVCSPFILPFSKIGINNITEAGGKNAALGEMFNQLTSLGVQVPDGFAVTAEAYKHFLSYNQLDEKLELQLLKLDTKKMSNLHEIGKACRDLVQQAFMPEDLLAPRAATMAFRTS